MDGQLLTCVYIRLMEKRVDKPPRIT